MERNHYPVKNKSNQEKIEASVNNAVKFIDIIKEFGSFDKYIWGFMNNKPVINKRESISRIPAKTDLSDMVSKGLKKRGFKFPCSTTAYAHLQATGIVNDHIVSCFRHKACR